MVDFKVKEAWNTLLHHGENNQKYSLKNHRFTTAKFAVYLQKVPNF